jgi:hypothetical protein
LLATCYDGTLSRLKHHAQCASEQQECGEGRSNNHGPGQLKIKIGAGRIEEE